MWPFRRRKNAAGGARAIGILRRAEAATITSFDAEGTLARLQCRVATPRPTKPLSVSCQFAYCGFPYKDMKRIALTLFASFALASSATSIEMTARSPSAQANAGFEMRLAAATTALQTIINQLLTCNNKGKIFASDASAAGRDTDGCIAAAVSQNPGVRLALMSHQSTQSSAGSSQQTTYTPWIAADICVLANVSPGTTDDNHSHGCWIETSGNNYRTASRSHKGNTRCDMLCYNLVPN